MMAAQRVIWEIVCKMVFYWEKQALRCLNCLPFFSGFQSFICYKALLSLHNGLRREEAMHHVTGK